MARCCLGEVRENQQGAGIPYGANRSLFALAHFGSWLAIMNAACPRLGSIYDKLHRRHEEQ